jgi:hypothetical protein
VAFRNRIRNGTRLRRTNIRPLDTDMFLTAIIRTVNSDSILNNSTLSNTFNNILNSNTLSTLNMSSRLVTCRLNK